MLPVLIAGAGVGGLTLAIELARRGIPSRVFEARAEPPREGAGIQLGPNATRVLQAMGIADQLLPSVVRPECIAVNDGVSGCELTRLPLGAWIEERHGAPYWVVHRAALHEALWLTAVADRLIEIETGRAVETVFEPTEQTGVRISLDDGAIVSGRLLVGADGLWSKIRAHVDPDFRLVYGGTTAARALVPRSEVAARIGEPVTSVWLAPSAHVVHYPIDDGETIAIVAIGAREEPTVGWASAVERQEVIALFAKMPSVVKELLALADSWRQWSLYRAGASAHLSRGKCVLIGDAAHPILPFLAQGGAMAIEDGYELAQAISSADEVSESLLSAFCERRGRRVRRMQDASAANGRTYHLRGPAALARNLALRALPGSFFMRRYDWIYGYRAIGIE